MECQKIILDITAFIVFMEIHVGSQEYDRIS